MTAWIIVKNFLKKYLMANQITTFRPSRVTPSLHQVIKLCHELLPYFFILSAFVLCLGEAFFRDDFVLLYFQVQILSRHGC
jgi:hypothetical protein